MLGGVGARDARDNGDGGAFANGRRVRQRKEAESEEITFQGPGRFHNQKLTVIKGTHAAEDSRWILIVRVLVCNA
jgi:hypothetical protein